MQRRVGVRAQHAHAIESLLTDSLAAGFNTLAREITDVARDDGELNSLLDGSLAQLVMARAARFVGRDERLMNQHDAHLPILSWASPVGRAPRRQRWPISSTSSPRRRSSRPARASRAIG